MTRMSRPSPIVPACALALALGACGGEQPPIAAPEPPPAPALDQPPPPTAAEILDLAIAAAGGLEKIEAASSWISTSKGVYMGAPYESKNVYKEGVVRMDVTMPGGEPMSMVMAADPCWTRTGPVVTSCTAEERAANGVMSAMGEAMRLAPLERPGWEYSARRETVDGRPADVFEVRNAAAGAAGVLVLDAETHLLTRASYLTAMRGAEVEVVVTPSEYAELCGVRMPRRSVSTLGGAPYVEEEIVDIRCGAVDDAVFAEPPQVADGTIVERELPAAAVACVEAKGPYDGIGAAFGKLAELMAQRKLAPAGAAVLIYRKGPADTKIAKDWITDVCFPVALPPPAAAERDGDLAIAALPATKALSAYGVGPCAARAPELAKLVAKEAAKRKLKPAGKLRQVSYSDPAAVPPEKQVSEMQLPVR